MCTRRRRSDVQASSRKSSQSSFRCRRVLPLGPFRSRDTTPSPTFGVDAAWRTRWTRRSTSPVPRGRSIAAAFFREPAATSPTPNCSLCSPVGRARRPAAADMGCDHQPTRGSSSGTDDSWAVLSRPPYSPWSDTIQVELNLPTKPSRTTYQRRLWPVSSRRLLVPAGHELQSELAHRMTARRCSEWPALDQSLGTWISSQAAMSSEQRVMICRRSGARTTWTTFHLPLGLWLTLPCTIYWRSSHCWQRTRRRSICDQVSAYCHHNKRLIRQTIL